MKSTLFLLAAGMLLTACAVPAYSQSKKDSIPPVFGTYDVAADPALQLRSAMSEALRSKKRILVEVGGDWCKWCHYLDTFFDKNDDITSFLTKHFVLIKVNFSPENENKKFLSAYPKPAGYPHIYVLDANGKLLHSQDTAKLEKGQGYDREAMMSFLQAWALSGSSADF